MAFKITVLWKLGDMNWRTAYMVLSIKRARDENRPINILDFAMVA